MKARRGGMVSARTLLGWNKGAREGKSAYLRLGLRLALNVGTHDCVWGRKEKKEG